MRVLIRNTFIVWILTFLAGFVVGFAQGLGAIAPSNWMAVIALGNFIFGIVGFTIVGAMTKISRFKHLFKVMLAVWALSLINVLIGPFTLTNWILSFLFLLVTMLVGGAISFLFVPSPNTSLNQDISSSDS